MTTVALVRTPTGSTSYVDDIANNWTTIENTLNSLLATQAAGLDVGNLLTALCGSSYPAIIDPGDFSQLSATIVGADVTVGAGFAWLPNAGALRRNTTTRTVAMGALGDGTYYISLSDAGIPIIQSSMDALYTVVKAGGVLTTLTRAAVMCANLFDWKRIRLDPYDPASANPGDAWFSNLQQNLRWQSKAGLLAAGGLADFLTGDTVVSQTAADQDLHAALTVPASSLAPGKNIRIRSAGHFDGIACTELAPAILTLKAKCGASTVISAAFVAAATGAQNGTGTWWLEADLVVSAGNKLRGSMVLHFNVGGGAGYAAPVVVTTVADVAFTFSSSNVIRLAVLCSLAGAGTFTQTTFTAELIN